MSAKTVYELHNAAVAYAEMHEQIGNYADIDKRMTPEKIAWRDAASKRLYDAAIALASLETEPNESRELCFARYILGQRVDVTGEVRALAEDTVAKAKLRARKR